MNWMELVTTIASVATAVAVFFAWWQIRLAKRQAITQFEDSLGREYREIAQRIPVKALLGEEIEEKLYEKALDDFYRYIDLTNEQVFLRQNNRVTLKTWENWCDGIESNLSRPAFKKAWAEIKSRATESFNELRRLEASGFKDDPCKWQ
jgi:hypothetical protein